MMASLLQVLSQAAFQKRTHRITITGNKNSNFYQADIYNFLLFSKEILASNPLNF